MKTKKIILSIIVILFSVLAFVGCNSTDNTTNVLGDIYTTEYVISYIKEHNELPEYYITKDEAKDLGWISSDGNLWDVAPDRVIGGDIFGNREGLLPSDNGRIWYEADFEYSGGYRGDKRIVFSNDGLIYITYDHYQTFEQVK